MLRELVEHHVEEEESTGFRCARDDFGKDELEAMAERFQTRKAQLVTRVAWSRLALSAWQVGGDMTVSNVHPQGASAAPQSAPPSWVILLSALLVAIGMAWRSSAVAASRDGTRSDRAPADPKPQQDGHGRSASAPSEIPWPGWKDILLRVYQRVTRDRILLIAAGVTFYLVLAIFPGISALVSVYGLFFDPKSMVGHLNLMASVAPGGAIDVLRDQLTRLGQQSGTALGIGFFVGLVIALWSATSGVKAIFDGLNVAYEEEEKSGFVKLTAVALAFTMGLIAFILLALAAVVALPVALELRSAVGVDRHYPEDCALADPVRAGRCRPVYFLPLRPEPGRTAMAMDHLGQRIGVCVMAHRLDPVLLVCREFRQLQQNLRVAWRNHRLYDLGVAVDHRRPRRRPAQCRDRASDGAAEHRGPAAAARGARRENGRYHRSGAELSCRPLMRRRGRAQNTEYAPATNPLVV